jgi:hypothetical protein
MDRDCQDEERENGKQGKGNKEKFRLLALSLFNIFSFPFFCIYPDNLCPSLLISCFCPARLKLRIERA